MRGGPKHSLHSSQTESSGARSLRQLVDSAAGSAESELHLSGVEATLVGRVVDVDSNGVASAGARVELERPDGSVTPLRASEVRLHELVSPQTDNERGFELPRTTPVAHGHHASAAEFSPVRGPVRIASGVEDAIVREVAVPIAENVIEVDGAPRRGAIVIAAALDSPGELRTRVAPEAERCATDPVLPREQRWIAADGARDGGPDSRALRRRRESRGSRNAALRRVGRASGSATKQTCARPAADCDRPRIERSRAFQRGQITDTR